MRPRSVSGGVVLVLLVFCLPGSSAKPEPGDNRKTIRVATVLQPFEQADIYSGVPGFMVKQAVDLGSQVKKGDILIEIDVPELRANLKKSRAALQAARAQVSSASLTIRLARQTVKAAEQRVHLAELACKRRQVQLVRCKAAGIGQGDREARAGAKEAIEDSDLARQEADLVLAEEQEKLARCRLLVMHEEARHSEAEAKEEQARCEVERVSTLVERATIRAPFDGVITDRTSFPGDFVRAPGQGVAPLLTLARMDRFRAVVPIPDRYVPWLRTGAPARVEIEALPDKLFRGKVSRMSYSENPQSRTMRVEIDLDNPGGELRGGMFGYATINLDQEIGENDRAKEP